MSEGHVTPRMVVRDVVGATDETGALVSASDRTVELSLDELGRLALELGAEGITALVAYLAVLRKETLPGDREALVVDDFSGRWLQENTHLTRNASWRAQKAVEESGLFDRIRSTANHGARGRQRAVLNSGLVLLPGGHGAGHTGMEDLKVARRGARPSPFPRKAGERENGVRAPIPRLLGNRGNGAKSQSPRRRGNGTTVVASSQVNAGLAETRQAVVGVTSSESSSEEVTHCPLMTDPTTGSAGVVPALIAPALATNRRRVLAVIREALNENTRHPDRLATVVTKLGLEGPRSPHVSLLTDAFADLIENPDNVWAFFAALDVKGNPPPLPKELAVERFILGVLTALGVGKLRSLGSYMWAVLNKDDWEPMGCEPLQSVVAALRTMHADDARREQKLSGYRPDAQTTDAPADDAHPDDAHPGETTADETVADETTGDELTKPHAAPEGLGPADLPEDVVREHLPAALENPAFEDFAELAKRGNQVFTRRLVWLHLEGTGQLSAVMADRAS